MQNKSGPRLSPCFNRPPAREKSTDTNYGGSSARAAGVLPHQCADSSVAAGLLRSSSTAGPRLERGLARSVLAGNAGGTVPAPRAVRHRSGLHLWPLGLSGRAPGRSGNLPVAAVRPLGAGARRESRGGLPVPAPHPPPLLALGLAHLVSGAGRSLDRGAIPALRGRLRNHRVDRRKRLSHFGALWGRRFRLPTGFPTASEPGGARPCLRPQRACQAGGAAAGGGPGPRDSSR